MSRDIEALLNELTKIKQYLTILC